MEGIRGVHTQMERHPGTLQTTHQRVRRKEITAKVVELVAGEAVTYERTA